jgi:predicted dehydrogenase
MDMSIHHFDLMRAVLGQEPREIVCRAFNPPWSNFAEPAAAAATITFDAGAVVSYRGSWVSPGPPTLWSGEWRMECAGGEISWTSRADQGTDSDRVTIRLLGKRPRRVELPPMPYYDRAGALRAFLHAIEQGIEPESSGRDNLGSIALMHAAIEAARSGMLLPVPAVVQPVSDSQAHA